LTRKRKNELQKRFHVEERDILYDGVPETSTKKFAKRIRNDRDSRIVETFVDFKTELKTKHEILQRVETIEKLGIN
jgi:hypothetical protein